MREAQRLINQLIWRGAGWILVNVILFIDLGINPLSLMGLSWIVLGTLFVVSIWSMAAAFVEGMCLMAGWNIYVWRLIELCLLGGISRLILTAVQ